MEELKQAALDTLYQKTNVAMGISGTTTVTTFFIENIQPWIPVIALTATLIFGLANTVINYKRYKRGLEK